MTSKTTRTKKKTKKKTIEAEAPSSELNTSLSNPDWISSVISVGHRPSADLSSEQKRLFRVFQSNLVSLLSHELRTPLMGILNALSALDENGEPLGGLSRVEALSMARTQSRKLEDALTTILDLAAWESGSLKMDLVECSWRECVVKSALWQFHDREETEGQFHHQVVLADPVKISRALSRLADFLELCGSTIQLKVFERGLSVSCVLNESSISRSEWDALWHEVLVAYEGGGPIPVHVFEGVLQSESSFLSRRREGLGAGLHLVAEVLRQHEARFTTHDASGNVQVKIEFPVIEGRSRLVRVLRSRIWKPGSATPAPVWIRGYTAEAGAAIQGRDGFYPGWGGGDYWVEFSDRDSEPSGVRPAIKLFCPRDGYDAEALLETVRAAVGAAGASSR